jgi:hypothetical protein
VALVAITTRWAERDDTMSDDGYNYVDFAEHVSGGLGKFDRFADRLHAGSPAPAFALTRLDDGTRVEMAELWRRTPTVLEFGSFT